MSWIQTVLVHLGSCVKKAEAAKAAELREKNAEIQRLRVRLNIGPITTQKGPSTQQSQGIILFTQNFGR
jgi:hypothetical protein